MLRGVLDDFQFGRAVSGCENFLYSTEYPVLDQVFWAIPALHDRKILEDQNARLPDLERQIRPRRCQFGPTNRASHDFHLLVWKKTRSSLHYDNA